MSRASPLIVLCLIALLAALITLPCPNAAWASCGTGVGPTGQYLDEESASDEGGDPDELDSTDGRVKIMVKSQPPGGSAALTAGPEAEFEWQAAGELTVLIQLLSTIL